MNLSIVVFVKCINIYHHGIGVYHGCVSHTYDVMLLTAGPGSKYYELRKGEAW